MSRKQDIMGQGISDCDYAILSALMRAEEPMKVIRISEITNGVYSDMKLYSTLYDLNRRGLVLKDEKMEEIRPDHKVKQVYWSLSEQTRSAMRASD